MVRMEWVRHSERFDEENLMKKQIVRTIGISILALFFLAFLALAVNTLMGPKVGNIFSSVNNCLGCETFTPRPDATPTLRSAFDEVDNQFKNLLRASIAFNKPEEMKKGQTSNIELILNPSLSESDLAAQLVVQGDFVTSTADPQVLIAPDGASVSVETSQIEITPRMKAVLVSSDPDAFVVVALHDDPEQAVSSVDTTTWRWAVTAKKEGAQTLSLVIYRLVKYDGKEFWHEVETYNATIVVQVTALDQFMSLDWKWIAGFILTLIGSVLGVLSWLNSRDKPAAARSTIRDGGVQPVRTGNYEKEVFVSYAWGGESEALVDELEKAFAAQSIPIVRDKKNLDYKGSIEEFEQRIGRGQCIVLVISDKYLRSEHCMYELVQADEHQNLRERIFPIILADAGIHTSVDRLNYIQYWDAKIDKLNQAIKDVKMMTNLTGMIADLDRYARIRASFDHLSDLLGDMNALTPELHAAHDFSTLIRAVQGAMGGK